MAVAQLGVGDKRLRSRFVPVSGARTADQHRPMLPTSGSSVEPRPPLVRCVYRLPATVNRTEKTDTDCDLPGTEIVLAMGRGTSKLGGRRDRRATEIAGLRCGIEAEMTPTDTAEMYRGGAAETPAGKAFAGRRDDVLWSASLHAERLARPVARSL